MSVTGLVIACLIYHSAHGLPDTQIVGGIDAPDGQYPYQVSLKNLQSKTHFCNGAIVSERYIITAAHCFNSMSNNPFNVRVDVGSNHINNFQTTYTAETLIPHPNYNQKPDINDIGLIKLTRNIEFNEKVKSIALISHDDKFDGTEFIVTGWGRLSNGSMPERLQQIAMTGYPQSKCNDTYHNITKNHICALQSWGQGLCDGDSGSSLTLKDELVGIASFGISCAKGNPDVFTRVFHYKSWVDKYINAGSNQQLNILLGLFTTYLCIHSFL